MRRDVVQATETRAGHPPRRDQDNEIPNSLVKGMGVSVKNGVLHVCRSYIRGGLSASSGW